ncbi:MAG: aldo/keto reductase [Planctomycetota bacterium]|nr:MAG: aldo/keto reductase [Planctomycetota bacterium]
MSVFDNDRFTRRNFLEATSRGAAAVGLGGLASSTMPTAKSDESQKPKLPAGVLGRTKYPVTLISFGAILIGEKLGTRILKAAIDQGVNLVHTSKSYRGGRSIEACGRLFKADKKYRDKVFFCLKSFTPEKESETDDGLKMLGTDHVDVVLTEFHKPSLKRLEAIQAQQDKLKKKGKVRYTGFVCHVDMNGAMEMVLEKAPDYFDITLMAMGMAAAGKSKDKSDADTQRFLKNLKALREKGIGILSMKSGAKKVVTKGAKLFQAHAKAILEAGADSVLTSMNTLQQVQMLKNLDLKNPHLTPRERKAAVDLDRSRSDACLMCGRCNKVCPRGLPVSDLMRIRMYHDEYGWPDHARDEFSMLDVDAPGLSTACGNCSVCTDVCPVGLAGAGTVQQVASFFV